MFKQLAKLVDPRFLWPESRPILAHKISFAIQRGSTASLLGTLPESEAMEEFFDADM